MCGICGIQRFGASGGDDLATVRAMAARLVPRGPDDEGSHQEGRTTLGNRRLAIQDLSPAGHMPMVSASGRHVVTFNGEIYNFRELRTRLEAKGHVVSRTSDPEPVAGGRARKLFRATESGLDITRRSRRPHVRRGRRRDPADRVGRACYRRCGGVVARVIGAFCRPIRRLDARG